jgi:hypothetical protein
LLKIRERQYLKLGGEAEGLLEMMAHNYYDRNNNEEDDIEIFPKKRGVLKLSNEDMREALRATEEKVIKYIDHKELSEKGIKLPIDEPCFPYYGTCYFSGKRKGNSSY